MADELILSKQEIVFELVSVAQRVHESLDLINKTEKNLYFKIMTATKGRYVVKPSVGVIDPLSSLTVDIMMIASDIEGDHANIMDKFAIYSCTSDEQVTGRTYIEELMNRRKDSWKTTRFTASIVWINSMQPVSFRCQMPIQDHIEPKTETRNNKSSVNESEMYSTVSHSELAQPVTISSEIVIPPSESFKKNSVIPSSTIYESEPIIAKPEEMIKKQSTNQPERTEHASSTIKSRSHTSTNIAKNDAQPHVEQNVSNTLLDIMPKKLTVS